MKLFLLSFIVCLTARGQVGSYYSGQSQYPEMTITENSEVWDVTLMRSAAGIFRNTFFRHPYPSESAQFKISKNDCPVLENCSVETTINYSSIVGQHFEAKVRAEILLQKREDHLSVDLHFSGAQASAQFRDDLRTSPAPAE